MNNIRPFYKKAVIFCSLIIFIIIFTYPLVFRINSSIAGFENTDEPYWSLWYFWWLGHSFNNNLNPTFSPLLAAPFGLNLGRQMYPVWDFVSRFLVIGFGQISAYNFQIIFSLVFSAFFMYLLTYGLTSSRMAGMLSGIIYSFSPYHMVRIWQHLNLIQIEWLALYVLLLSWIREKPALKNAVFAALCLSLVAFYNYYYAYFASMVAVIFAIFIIFGDKENPVKKIKLIILSMLGASLIVAPFLFHFFKSLSSSAGRGDWSYLRPFDHLFSQSARPLSYLLPSVDHPIFGKFTENFVGTQLYGLSLTEHILYLGWIPLLLAFYAFRIWRQSRQSSLRLRFKAAVVSRQIALSGKERFYIGFFVFLAIAAWFFSQPPWWKIGPLKVYMPSFFMYKILPMFRAYSRFGIVVMLAVAVLAGFGLKFILDRFKSRNLRIAATVSCCALVLFEFWNWPPYKVIDVSRVPAVYYWLKDRPGNFTIAEYPLDAVAPDQMYRFSQTTHEKKIINDTVPWTPANDLAKTITALSESRTAGILKWMQVKYVIVHRERYLNTGLVKDKEEFDKIPQNKGLNLIKTFSAQECPRKDIMCIQKTGPIDVYEIIATPVKPELTEK